MQTLHRVTESPERRYGLGSRVVDVSFALACLHPRVVPRALPRASTQSAQCPAGPSAKRHCDGMITHAMEASLDVSQPKSMGATRLHVSA